MFVTSGHATERDWQIGFRYRNGQFRSRAGHSSGWTPTGTLSRSFRQSQGLPAGWQLPDGPHRRARRHGAGLYEQCGRVPDDGLHGADLVRLRRLGVLDYFLEQPGRFTLAEAFFANQQALIHRLATCFPAESAEQDDHAGGQSRASAAGSPGRSDVGRREGTALRPGQRGLLRRSGLDARMAPGRSPGSRRSRKTTASIVSRSGPCAASGALRPSTPTARSAAVGPSSNCCRTDSRPAAFRSWKAAI